MSTTKATKTKTTKATKTASSPIDAGDVLAANVATLAAASIIEAMPIAVEAPLTWALRAEARRKMNEATKATSAHAFALIACEGDNDVQRIDAMRAKLREWPEGIRAAACKLARSKVQPSSRTDELLKHLHDEQPASSKTASTTSSKTTDGTIIVRKNNEELIVRWLGEDRVGRQFKQHRAEVDGKLVITLTEV